MATVQHEHETHGEVASLVSGIIQDARQLIGQQMTLFQVELKHDLRRTVEACIPLAIGLSLVFVALITLAASCAYLLCWVWPELPIWAGFGIVGGCIGLAGAALALGGILKFKTFGPPGEKSVEGLKENLQWKTKT
jgi:uncharacterized membrane protein YqjE